MGTATGSLAFVYLAPFTLAAADVVAAEGDASAAAEGGGEVNEMGDEMGKRGCV
jgi:hypothetical protein